MTASDHTPAGAAVRPADGQRAREWFWHGFSLRSRLMLLGVAAILPLCLFATAAFVVMVHQQKQQVEQATLGMAQALGAAIDARMQRTVATLEAFALAQSLQDADESRLGAVHAAARQLRAASPDWRAVVLARPDGGVVFVSELPLGSDARESLHGASVSEVVRTRAAAVGPMLMGPRGYLGYTVRVPVLHEGEVRYVLTAIVSTDSILEVIQRQQLPGHWVVSVFDSDLKRVARSKDHGKHFGTPPSPSLQRMLEEMGDRREGVGMTSTLEGDEAYTAVSHIQRTGWTIALGASSEIAHAGLWRAAWLYVAGLLLSLGAGGMVFWLVSRSITVRAQALRDGAVALGKGVPLPPPPQGLPDFDEVASALWTAGQERSRAEEEREGLLRSERGSRAVAEAARGRLQMLLSATSSLTQSLDESRTIDAIAAAVVPGVADMLRLDLLSLDGAPAQSWTFHPDPARLEAAQRVVRSGPVPASMKGSLPWVIATGREHVQHFEPGDVSKIEDARYREFAEASGMRAVCAVPLVARDRVIGAMAAIQVDSVRRFEADDVALISELARRAALALDNVRLYSECNIALEKANAASKAKDDFLAMLGHELRNPLAPILTATEIMKRRDATTFVREREIIERQARHLTLLVDDLLDVSRIVAGKIGLQLEQVDLRQVACRAIEVTQPLFAQRAEPVVHAEEGPIGVRGDFLRLAQVVGNLLSNAAKFSDPGDPVTIWLRRSASEALLTVEDRGTGIPDELMPRVFDRFVQGEQSLQRSKSGLGLGLTIARSIVERHGGTIVAERGRDGRGTRVTVSLPLALPAEAAVEPCEEASPPARSGELARVLVVDDNVDAAQTLASLLLICGHEVSTALNAEECLAMVADQAPDVCIVDIGLPGMDGYELARRLRAEPATRSMHLIALTGYGQPADRDMALRSGFNDHMAKPVDIGALEAALDAVGRHPAG
ncbi:MAG: response regulator [Hydrogenophaga sp.]|uniref:hybrid sensor histidine kinase/response regulator n=1 Tax=Hydrogenophaga sp. TaxID=1904254 RepID=UPI00260CC693|nr:ATP-binding protein [Hydrogenophaga sp.]MCW5669116.1 response regulator [Hydrogenophaga sp.]